MNSWLEFKLRELTWAWNCMFFCSRYGHVFAHPTHMYVAIRDKRQSVDCARCAETYWAPGLYEFPDWMHQGGKS
ncbi:hypothetical protein LCGC14_1032040 [marine sediment metagenome]|uniref:Uncharacterized protein n=1 Tax=marine sediment metagenome TaxID=412755 RepID=A0A0F9MUB1_9ZZZZ